MSGTVFEGSGGGAWVMGNETFDHSRASMDRVMGDRLAGRPLGDAEQIGANEKAAIKIRSTGLKTFTAMAQTPYLNTIRCRARGGVMGKFCQLSGRSWNICKCRCQHPGYRQI